MNYIKRKYTNTDLRKGNELTERERFLRCMNFEKIDRIPLMEMGIWEETFERWHKEGLPEWVTNIRQLEDHFGLDISYNLNWLPIEQSIFPYFEEKIIEEDAENVIVQDATGTVLKKRKHMGTIPQYIKFPVENRKDYEKLQPRLQAELDSRYPEDFEDQVEWRYQRGEIIGLSVQGFFGFPRGLMGFENLCYSFFEQPDLISVMIKDRLKFIKKLLKRALASKKIDFVQIWEDMAYKSGSMISPDTVRELMQPCYEELVDYLKSEGVKLVMVDCDGWVGQLLPIYLESGIDGVYPCEMAAGSDPVKLREKHPDSRFMGGMDKRLIAKGREQIDKELERVSGLVKEGGYIPFLDHYVPPDVSLEDYVYYVERRRDLLNSI